MLPDSLAKIGYDQYRGIRFNPAKALWREQGLPFQAQFFHRAFLFRDRVDVYTVAGGMAQPLIYRPEQFTFQGTPAPAESDLGFAGFRLHSPINRPDYFDEVCAFLGASYFRAVAKGQAYGLSARGLALKTGEKAEEFPVFRAFWLEQPARGADRAGRACADGFSQRRRRVPLRDPAGRGDRVRCLNASCIRGSNWTRRASHR